MRLLRQVKLGRTGATLDEQLTLIWNNLRAILASADMSIDNIVRLTSYLRDASFVEANQNARLAPLVALGGRAVPTTAIVAQTLHEDWLARTARIPLTSLAKRSRRTASRCPEVGWDGSVCCSI